MKSSGHLKHQYAPFRHHLDWTEVLVVGNAVNQWTTSKKLLEFLHGFDLSVDYSLILRFEMQLAKGIIVSTREEEAYFPATMHKGIFSCAVDNSDFNKDTPDGKDTLHTTATTLYQRHESFTDPDRHNTRKVRLHGQKTTTTENALSQVWLLQNVYLAVHQENKVSMVLPPLIASSIR